MHGWLLLSCSDAQICGAVMLAYGHRHWPIHSATPQPRTPTQGEDRSTIIVRHPARSCRRQLVDCVPIGKNQLDFLVWTRTHRLPIGATLSNVSAIMHCFFFERWSCRTTECALLHLWCAMSVSGRRQHASIQFGGAHDSNTGRMPNGPMIAAVATKLMGAKSPLAAETCEQDSGPFVRV